MILELQELVSFLQRSLTGDVEPTEARAEEGMWSRKNKIDYELPNFKNSLYFLQFYM